MVATAFITKTMLSFQDEHDTNCVAVQNIFFILPKFVLSAPGLGGAGGVGGVGGVGGIGGFGGVGGTGGLYPGQVPGGIISSRRNKKTNCSHASGLMTEAFIPHQKTELLDGRK